jgi:hypothetical protein
MVDALPREKDERTKFKIITERSWLIVNKRAFDELSDFSVLIKVAVKETGSCVQGCFKKSLHGTRPQTNPLTWKDHRDKIGLAPIHDRHKIVPGREMIDTDRFNSLGKAFGILGVGNNP